MPINRGLLTSLTDQWATPQEVFDRLNAEFHFELDVCALPSNAKCKRSTARKKTASSNHRQRDGLQPQNAP